MVLEIKIAIEIALVFVYHVNSMKKNGRLSVWILIILAVLGGTLGTSYIFRQKSPVTIEKIMIGGNSMSPLFKDGDEIKVNTTFQKNTLKRGDIIVFNIKDPANSTGTSIKRVIAMGGDTIKLIKGAVYVNSIRLDEPYLAKQNVTYGNESLSEETDLRIPEGMIFVMGDEREHSFDSRIIGSIKIEDVIALIVDK